MSEPIIVNANTPAAPITVVPNSTPPVPTGDWSSGFDDTMKGYIQNKGFKTAADLANAYQNLEKFHGVPQERMLKLPEKEDAPEWGGIYDRLGRPKEAKDYQLEIPKEIGDEKFAEAAKGWFHELGLSKKQGETIATKWNEYVSGQVGAQKEAVANGLVQEQTALKKEWGAAYDENIQVSKEGARRYGFDKPTLDKLENAMGHNGLMKLMQRLGSATSEGRYVGGNPQGGFGDTLAPASAKAKMDQLLSDGAFKTKYMNGDKAAIDQINSLGKQAYPGDAV